MMKANPGSVYVESTSSQETLKQTVPNAPITTQYVTISTNNKVQPTKTATVYHKNKNKRKANYESKLSFKT